MREFFFGIVILMYMLPGFAVKNKCILEINGYKVIENSVYPFVVDKEKACFLAFYTTNPDPVVGAQGDGNLGDAVWYGYYKINNPGKIYEFPKPLSGKAWSNVCSIAAISFYPMHGGKTRDVTIIGTCDKQNVMNATFPFVFTWQGDKYVLDEDVYSNLFGFISLTVADVRAYIKSPNTCYQFLKNRFNWHNDDKITCD